MKKTLYVRPAEGLTIPDPATGAHLPAAGAGVDDCPYWRRRLREKSVELTDKEAIAAATAKAEKARLAAEAKARTEAEGAGAPREVEQAEVPSAQRVAKGGK